MIYLNIFKQLEDEAAEALYSLVKDLVNENTTNILEVGTYAGQATVKLCAAAGEKNYSVNVISIDRNHNAFSPTAQESLRANSFTNYFIDSGDLEQKFEQNIIKANIIYIDRFHEQIEEKLKFIEKNVIVPTKVIFRNPKNSSSYPFDVKEFTPEVKPRARIKKDIQKRVAAAAEITREEVEETTQNKKTTP